VSFHDQPQIGAPDAGQPEAPLLRFSKEEFLGLAGFPPFTEVCDLASSCGFSD